MQHNNRVDTFSICLAGVLFSDFALLMADPTVAFFSSFEGVDVIFKYATDDSVLDRECLELDLASTTKGLLFPFPPEEGTEALLTLTDPRLFLFDCFKTDADVLVIRSTDFGVSAITLPSLELILLLPPSAIEIDRVDPRASELLVMIRFSVGFACREDIAVLI